MFSGNVIAEWLENGRDMRLEKTVTYTDPMGVVWIAEQGSIINGASIPRIVWPMIGSPFVGKYRRPSVFHDVYYNLRNRPPAQVDRMFYLAMLEEGVSEEKARMMYNAVRAFAPKWDDLGVLIEPPESPFLA